MVATRMANLPRQRLGQAATRCFPSNETNASFTRAMSRTFHIAREELVHPTVIYGNWLMSAAAEVDGGAGASLKVALEYPAGVFTLANECVAAGGAGINWPAGASLAFTFDVTVPRGQPFYLRAYQAAPAGAIWCRVAGGNAGFGPAPGDYMDIGTTDNDRTTSGAIGSWSNGICLYPLVIATLTRQPGVLIVGDSREAGGVGGVTDTGCDLGPPARIVGRRFGYTAFVQSATRLSQWNAGSHGHLAALVAAGYWSHALDCYGVNDASDGTSAATLVGARAAFAAALKGSRPDLVVIGNTLYPFVTSADVFVSKSGQSLGTVEPRILSLNDAIRAGIVGEDYCWDEADGLDPLREGRYPVSRDPGAASRTPASVTGSITGAVLTVSAVGSGALAAGDYLYDAGGRIADSTWIVEQLTGTAGGIGTYRLSKAHDGFPRPSAVASTTITTAGQITRDGIHAQFAGEELIVRRAGPQLLQLIAT